MPDVNLAQHVAVPQSSNPNYTQGTLANVLMDPTTGALKVYVAADISTTTTAATGLGKTLHLTVTDVTPVAIVTQTVCSSVTIQEDNGVSNYPTVQFNIKRPTSGDTATTYGFGRSYTFTAPFRQQWAAGVTLGYVQLPSSGSTTFTQDEQA